MKPKFKPLSRRAAMAGLVALPAIDWWAQAESAESLLAVPQAATVAQAGKVLNVAEFEALARAVLPPAHFGYLATGADDDLTVAANHAAFGHIQIRARRMVDVSQLDTTVKVFGTRWATPIYLSAVSGMRAFHPEGEVGVARAARSRATEMMLSTGASMALEDVVEARGAPVWQQLYPTDDWRVTEGIVRRAERTGCPAIVLTADSLPGGRNNETEQRARAMDSRICTQCHVNNSHDLVRRAPMFAGLDVSQVHSLVPANWTWSYLDRLRRLVKVKLLIKGIVTREDALLALEHGADGIIVSNHGGNSEETLRPTIECLPEIAAAVAGRAPIFLDGGIRRGTDIFKALALGATAVGIGRPQGWGLAAFGTDGVAAVLDILTRELQRIMRQAGTPTLASITRAQVVLRQAVGDAG